MKVRLMDVDGHVEVWDWSGHFLFSADTPAEAWDELERIEKDCA